MASVTQRLNDKDIAHWTAPQEDDLASIRADIEKRIAYWLKGSGNKSDLLTLAMRAGALGAGKRMRPLLLILVARDLGCASPALIDVACAVELVHAASLVLDDMPCMDNAKLRRGKPAVHVQYGEDVAVLASVALLSRAFNILACAQDVPAAVRNRLVATLADTVGSQGLVRGQFEDLHGGGQRSADDIAVTNHLKTGLLLGVAVDMAAIICQADDATCQSLRDFAMAAGQAFQLRDDFQDVPGNDSAITGKDTGKDFGKATIINMLGMEEARRRLEQHLQDAERHLGDAIGGQQRTRGFVQALFADRGVAAAEAQRPLALALAPQYQ